MKLPSHIITQVKWFEHYREPTFDSFGDRFVLHFKQWWKPSKTIIIEGVFTKQEGNNQLFRQRSDAVELLAQLKAQCPDQA